MERKYDFIMCCKELVDIDCDTFSRRIRITDPSQYKLSKIITRKLLLRFRVIFLNRLYHFNCTDPTIQGNRALSSETPNQVQYGKSM